GVHDQHALVLVNYASKNGHSDGKKLLTLASDVAESVRETYGIALEMEPRVYGI
ncbi:MAG: UDP-N-acetylenolpyruvoylglucosamine reductase, partial [Halioglobus sp.]|nr:UDP-N-acetylenolpyruvoylglucosamine reductase [Halioglobus sp.]